MKFELTKEQVELLRPWIEEQNELVLKKQNEGRITDLDIIPFYGIAGGGLTYHFTPTTIGSPTLTVTNCVTGNEIDLTDYEEDV